MPGVSQAADQMVSDGSERLHLSGMIYSPAPKRVVMGSYPHPSSSPIIGDGRYQPANFAAPTGTVVTSAVHDISQSPTAVSRDIMRSQVDSDSSNDYSLNDFTLVQDIVERSVKIPQDASSATVNARDQIPA